MAFKKAQAQQAKFKAGLYGKQGSGKTFTALLMAEGLAKMEGKRVAFVDTEFGSDFYVQAIPERAVHPAEFDIDRVVTRSITETLEEVSAIDSAVHGVVCLDSMTHLWEAAQAAYSGPKMRNGQIPIHAWGAIKRPYKQLMSLLLSGDFHVLICGREGVRMDPDEDGEMQVAGTKMKAEGETGYEPHILIRMEAEWESGAYSNVAFFEKDRTGIYTGKRIVNPNFETIKPILRYLGPGVQGKLGDADSAAERDAAAIHAEQERAAADRQSTFEMIRAAIMGATTVDALKAAWDLTKGKKGKLGDLWDALETAKDARKAELVRA